MTVRFNVKNKVTINAVFRTTFPVAIGIGSVIGTPIFTHRHEWPFAVAVWTAGFVAWTRALTGMAPGLAIVAFRGGTVDVQEPTRDGIRRTKVSGSPADHSGFKIFLCLAALAPTLGLMPDVLHWAATIKSPSRTAAPAASAIANRVKRGNTSDQVAVIRKYYAAINERHWLSMWRLWGNDPAKAHGAAYRRMISGYRCTVHDEITAITPSQEATVVRVSAQESDGVVRAVQSYVLSYVIRHGTIETGTTLHTTGNPPPGCRR